jgi:hypothetical protein
LRMRGLALSVEQTIAQAAENTGVAVALLRIFACKNEGRLAASERSKGAWVAEANSILPEPTLGEIAIGRASCEHETV